MATESEPLLTNRKSRCSQYRRNSAEFLDSHVVHWTILSLTILDIGLVLADLIYTFLSLRDCSCPHPPSPSWLHHFAMISLAITVVFLIELPLNLFAFGFSYYNAFGSTPYAALHVFDITIVISTFLLEMLLKGREREIVSLLVFFRLWRIVKVVSGVAVGAGHLTEEQAKELAGLQVQLQVASQNLETLRAENQSLRNSLNVENTALPEQDSI